MGIRKENSLVSAGTTSTTESTTTSPTGPPRPRRLPRCSVHTEAECRDYCGRNFTMKGVFPFPDLRQNVRCCKGDGYRELPGTNICRNDECRVNAGSMLCTYRCSKFSECDGSIGSTATKLEEEEIKRLLKLRKEDEEDT